MSGTNLYRTPYSATAGTTPQYRAPKFSTGATNPYAYGYAASAGANANQPNTGGGMPTNAGPAVSAPQTTQQQLSQGASPYSAGYTPLQFQAGGNQDAFIQQQHAAFQQWLATPQGMAWAHAQPQTSQWFGQAIHPAPTPKPQVAGWTPGLGWGMHAPPNQGGPRQGQFNYGYDTGGQ